MIHLERPLNLILLLTFVLGLLAGTAAAQDQVKGITGDPDNPLTPINQSFQYTSDDGDFRVIWPSGCSSLKTRSPAEENFTETGEPGEFPVMVVCDRYGKEGQGCSVTALFNAQSQDGGPVGPAEVTNRVENLLREFGAEIKRQSPLQKDFGDGLMVTGLDVLAAQSGGSGQVWVRGLLVRGDIYIMAAWDLGGNLWDDPEYANFFNSFQPGTE